MPTSYPSNAFKAGLPTSLEHQLTLPVSKINMPIFKPVKNFQSPSQKPENEPPENEPPKDSARSFFEESQPKGLLGRLRNLQLSRPHPKPEILPDIESESSTSLQDEEKAARRRARREQRQKREEEWNEEYRKRRNFALEVGMEMQPLTPLSDFDSASEDERVIPSYHPTPANTKPPLHSDLTPEQPPHPATPPPLPHYAEETNSQPPTSPASQLTTNSPQQNETPNPSRDPNEEAQLAEMFGAQAYATPSSTSVPPQSYPTPSSYSNQPSSLNQPSPIGWGGVYHSVPSQPMYGTPVHLTPAPRTALDIDPMLSENIQRGRELAMLAIEQEERGNLGAAEAGYIKALSLLVPASKQLDTGSELNKNARMQQKAKIQREAAAMLDRCEELRVFLRANGPPVPSEMPAMPNQGSRRKPSSAPKRHSSLGSPPSRDLPPTPSEPPAPSASRTRKQNEQRSGLKLPPPPPDMPTGSSPSLLLNRLTSRKDVLASASTMIPPDTSRQPSVMNAPPAMLSQKQGPRTAEKCFMCSAPAQLRTKCGHSYCSNCGNQAVSVFGQCPVPDCGAAIAIEDFKHIL